ncbi:glycosyltransferase family 4 protein [Pelagicoccus sp. SDUM812002]|uniref:glycosyltransferase family 4 protein n=1 Tax=Pelagicoccus sp. SDUM812002 TaxID=3041266 RepID=UPI00280F981B|nr:glycosyltransferase family 4 protein [Pelagicoccus sp. SDUM812002]MDQ8188471.1 glycosyltransferase family 4 protein [Pelagicoccus sp. SDUM812002]
MNRQARNFSQLNPRFLTWRTNFDSGEFRVHDLKRDFDNDKSLTSKLTQRLRGTLSGNFFLPTPRESEDIAAAMQDETPVDAILCHYGHVALRMLPLAQANGIPLVAHFHGADISSSLRNNKYYRWSLRKNLPRFTACVAVGTKQVEALQGLGVPKDRIHLIPCGAPAELFTPKDYSSGLKERCKFITVSRLVEWKGVDIVVKAFLELAKERDDIELHVVGSGTLEPLLKELARGANSPELITFHGEKSEAEVRALVKNSSVFIQHSLDHESGWFEGFGVSVTEASLTSLPVIVTDSGGLSDQIKNKVNGLVVAQRSVESTLEAMKQLAVDDTLRKRLGLAGREIAMEQFEASKLSAKLEQLLYSVASGSL